jgi:CheY-like chemotaxis protein
MKYQPNVLVVDDNSDLLDTFSLILKRRGYNVDTANEGFAAIEKFKKYHFDVILMDVVMPGMNGVEAFRRISEIDPGVKVILMTAYYDESELRKALTNGVYQTVFKPVDIAQLMSLIKEAVSNQSILIVDDDLDFCEVLSRGLRMNGYRTSFATSGEEALGLAKTNKFEAAFIDVKMPGMDGFETSIRLQEANPGLLTVMMTGYRDEARERLETHNKACLYKPFNMNEIVEMVKVRK